MYVKTYDVPVNLKKNKKLQCGHLIQYGFGIESYKC